MAASGRPPPKVTCEIPLSTQICRQTLMTRPPYKGHVAYSRRANARITETPVGLTHFDAAPGWASGRDERSRSPLSYLLLGIAQVAGFEAVYLSRCVHTGAHGTPQNLPSIPRKTPRTPGKTSVRSAAQPGTQSSPILSSIEKGAQLRN
jgi:hypothetical protein